MVLMIRMRQHGRKNRQTFRLVLTDSRRPRDGKYLETLGSYNPTQAENNFIANTDRIQIWLEKGAQLSDNARNLLAKAAPAFIKSYQDKLEAAKVKKTAKRRALKKANKGAAPVKKTVKAAAKTEEKAAAPAPKKKAAPKKKKEDAS